MAEDILEDVLGHLEHNILSTLKLNGFKRDEFVNDTWLQAYRALVHRLPGVGHYSPEHIPRAVEEIVVAFMNAT